MLHVAASWEQDRHNGNILLDTCGHLIHTNFGVILGASVSGPGVPGGGLGVESAPFKLSGEMVEAMKEQADGLQLFEDLVVRAFLVARQPPVMDQLLAIVCCMADADMPCFKHKSSALVKLRARFVPDLSAAQAAKHMRGLVHESRAAWSTSAFDGIQKVQRGIFS